MVKLFMVRHGKTDWNAKGLTQGWTDIPLNEEGAESARKLAETFDGNQVDVCLCSPLLRAKQTAKILVDEEKIQYDPMLKERKLGDFEGKECTWEMIELLWDYKLNYHENEVESLKDCLERAKEILQKIKTNFDGKTVLLVTHGALMKTLQYNIEGYDENTDFLTKIPQNTTIYEYELN